MMTEIQTVDGGPKFAHLRRANINLFLNILQVADFTSAPIYIQQIKLYLKVTTRSVLWTTFTKVFDTTCWIFCGLICLSLMLFFCIILVYSENGMTLKKSGLSMFGVLLYFVGLGIPNVPNRLPGRILVSWSIFLLWCHNVGCPGVVQQGGKSRGLLLAWGSFTVFKSN